MPSATGQSWEKYKKEFADDEEPEKKITPLTDEYVYYRDHSMTAGSGCPGTIDANPDDQRHPSTEDLWRCAVRCRPETAGKTDQGEAD